MLKHKLVRLFGVALLSVFILIAFNNCGSKSSSDSNPAVTQVGSVISYSNVGKFGVFDPSLAKSPSSGRVWMAFSSVEQSPTWSANSQVVSAQLGYSDNGGATWIYSKVLNSFADVTLSQSAPNNAGTWVNEVPSLVYDSNSSQWILFWHHYLLINGSRHFEHGWIAYKSASDPTQLAQATEHKLFVGTAYDTTNNVTNGATQSPVSGGAEVDFPGLNSALSSCGILTEPGSLSISGSVYLSLHCVAMSSSSVTDNLIVLLKFDGSSWSYVGTLLNNANATAAGYNSGFSATDLFQANGTNYLMVTPVSSSPFAGFYNGCLVYQFTDISTGSLLKSGGSPFVVRSISGTPTRFNGACDYNSAASANGFVFSELDLSGASPVFRIVSSGTSL